jgi:hypothetical protein
MRLYYDYILSLLYPEFTASSKPKHAETYYENYLLTCEVFTTHITDFLSILTLRHEKEDMVLGRFVVFFFFFFF